MGHCLEEPKIFNWSNKSSRSRVLAEYAGRISERQSFSNQANTKLSIFSKMGWAFASG